MKKLVLLQKRIIRIIAVVSRSHTDPIFNELKLLKCNDINTYLIGRLMHRIYNGNITLLRSYFKENKDVHQYSTRQTNHYHAPCVKTELGKSALRYHGVLIWSKILNLRMNPEISEYEFSKLLRQYLIPNVLLSTMMFHVKLILASEVFSDQFLLFPSVQLIIFHHRFS